MPHFILKEMDRDVDNPNYYDTGDVDSDGDPIIHYKLQDDAPEYDEMLTRIGFAANLSLDEERYFENLK